MGFDLGYFYYLICVGLILEVRLRNNKTKEKSAAFPECSCLLGFSDKDILTFERCSDVPLLFFVRFPDEISEVFFFFFC